MDKIKIPKYTLGEELINSITHGIAGLFSIFGLVLLLLKCTNSFSVICSVIYSFTLIVLYIMSSIYHALSSKTSGKKVLRVIDHCNVHLLVFGSYFIVSLCGVRGPLGIVMSSVIGLFSLLGIIFSSINVDKYSIMSVIFHLLSGWSILICTNTLIDNITFNGFILIVIGGVMYTVGSILYGIGAKKKYFHSIFHLFCILGSLFQFLAIYNYII